MQLNFNYNDKKMIEDDKDLVFSEAVKAGKRIYYFDVKQSRNGDRYVAITESKKVTFGAGDNQQQKFEKHKLFLYREDYQKFVDALNKVIGIASEVPSPYNSFSSKAPEEEAIAEPSAAAPEAPAFDDAKTALDDLLKF